MRAKQGNDSLSVVVCWGEGAIDVQFLVEGDPKTGERK